MHSKSEIPSPSINLKPCTRRARLGGRREVRGGERLSFSIWRVALKKNRKTEKVYANFVRMLYQKQISAVLAQHMCTAGRLSKHGAFFTILKYGANEFPRNVRVW